MRLFLKAILILLFSFKLIAEGSALAYKSELVKALVEDKESKGEKDPLQEKDKWTGEDKWLTAYSNELLYWELKVNTLPVSPDQDAYTSFINQPNTPPPDYLN